MDPSGIKTAAAPALSPGWRSGTARGREPRDGVSRPTGSETPEARAAQRAGFLAGSQDCEGGGGEPPSPVHVQQRSHVSAVPQ